MKLVLILPLALLAGCAATQPRVQNEGCEAIAVKVYAPDFELKLADELGTAANKAMWPHAIADYRELRHDVRACQHKDAVR